MDAADKHRAAIADGRGKRHAEHAQMEHIGHHEVQRDIDPSHHGHAGQRQAGRAINFHKAHQGRGHDGGNRAEEIAAQVIDRGSKQLTLCTQQRSDPGRERQAEHREQAACNEHKQHRHRKDAVHLILLSLAHGAGCPRRAAAGANIAECGQNQRNGADDAHRAQRHRAEAPAHDHIVDEHAEGGCQCGEYACKHKGTIDAPYNGVLLDGLLHMNHFLVIAAIMSSCISK